MPTKGGGATILDRGHHLQLWKVQMAVICPAIGRPMGAENVRDLQAGAGHHGPSLPGASLALDQQIKRTGHVLDRFGCHLWVNCRRLQPGMAEQNLPSHRLPGNRLPGNKWPGCRSRPPTDA